MQGAATNVSAWFFGDGDSDSDSDISVSTTNCPVLNLLSRVQHLHHGAVREKPYTLTQLVGLTVFMTGLSGPVRQYEPGKDSFIQR